MLGHSEEPALRAASGEEGFEGSGRAGRRDGLDGFGGRDRFRGAGDLLVHLDFKQAGSWQFDLELEAAAVGGEFGRRRRERSRSVAGTTAQSGVSASPAVASAKRLSSAPCGSAPRRSSSRGRRWRVQSGRRGRRTAHLRCGVAPVRGQSVRQQERAWRSDRPSPDCPSHHVTRRFVRPPPQCRLAPDGEA